jgi:hypothetical protein
MVSTPQSIQPERLGSVVESSQRFQFAGCGGHLLTAVAAMEFVKYASREPSRRKKGLAEVALRDAGQEDLYHHVSHGGTRLKPNGSAEEAVKNEDEE